MFSLVCYLGCSGYCTVCDLFFYLELLKVHGDPLDGELKQYSAGHSNCNAILGIFIAARRHPATEIEVLSCMSFHASSVVALVCIVFCVV